MTAERQPASGEALQYEPRLLVVDPVVQTAGTIDRQLRAQGFACQVRGAATELELRAQLREFQPHVILASGRSASGLGGLNLLEIARTDAPDASLLIWGEPPEPDAAGDALQLGATDFIPKNEPRRLVLAMHRALRDVAARRTRRLAEERILDAEQRLRDLADASHDWIWELDSAGRITFSSEAVQRILGMAPRELLGRELLHLVHAEDRERVENALKTLGSTVRTAAGIVARWQARSGEYRSLEANARALLAASGAVSGYRGALRDVTDRCEREEQIAQLTRMLRMQSGLIEALVESREGSDG